MSDFPAPSIRLATPSDRSEIMDLICVSLNYWYRGIGRPTLIPRGPDACSVFLDVYEAIDPGCCVVAEEPRTGRLMGSCFFHPRETHFSLGIMNAHPNYFGRGAAAALLRYITALADRQGKPIRLVSSAMNLDSYSLYTRAGFSAIQLYQDMIVPADRVEEDLAGVDVSRVRPAVAADVPAIAELEWRVSRIRRENDWRFFIDNAMGIWHVSVHGETGGKINGVLASVNHPGNNMLGPGVMVNDAAVAVALIAAELCHHAGRTPVFLVPADHRELIRTLYARGARNLELHVAQVRGEFTPFDGISMPTFMPETG
jgi:GNAT superfamily N-acetyltransferase